MERSGNSCSLVELPLEVLEVVAGHLSVRDLLACCACSHDMRDVFSDDSIWRPRCDRQLCEYLKDTPCKVEPHFITPKFEHTTLSSIPQWKTEFMRQNHLWNNWRQGRKVEEVIQSQETARSRCMDNSIFHFFLNNDCIIAVYPDRIEFLDVRQTPIEKAASDIKLPFFPREPGFKVMTNGGSFVIILYRSLVQVYHVDFSTKESILKNVFFIEDSQKTADLHGVKDVKHFMENANLNINNRFVRAVEMVGNLLVAFQDGESNMHIWDVESGLKVKMQDCPVKKASVVDFKRSSGKMNIIICVEEQQSDSRTFLAYDITTLTFLPFQETFKGRSGFCSLDKYVAIWAKGVLNVYDYVTSKLVLKNQPIQSHCQGVRKSFVFLQNNILKIFFPSSQLVNSLVSETETPFPHKLSWFEILNDNFIQVGGITVSSLSVYEVDDDFKLKKSSLNLRFQSCSFFLNKNSSRYIVRSGCGNVIHFW